MTRSSMCAVKAAVTVAPGLCEPAVSLYQTTANSTAWRVRCQQRSAYASCCEGVCEQQGRYPGAHVHYTQEGTAVGWKQPNPAVWLW